MDQVPHPAQPAAVDRAHQPGHPGVQRFGFLNAAFAPHPAQRGMFNRAAFGDVDLFTGKHRPARLLEPHRLGQRGKTGQMGRIKVGLGPIEPDRPAGQVKPR